MTTPHRIEPHAKKFATVDGKRMAYVELGGGDGILEKQLEEITHPEE